MIQAGAAVLAAIVSFCVVYALSSRSGTGTQPAITAAILGVGLSRRAPQAAGASVMLLPAVLIGVAVAASAVGSLLRTVPPAGAAVFTGGVFLSVWLRNFDERARGAGALIALPLVAMLIIPPPTPAPGGPLVVYAVLALAGIVALVAATGVQWLVGRLGAEATEAKLRVAVPPAAREQRAGAGPSASTRMALQMAVAVAGAFALGFALFAGHWGWTVLTAFIVCSGALGRGDAMYKGVLRLGGALAGTVAAAIFTHLWVPQGILEAIAIFALLFLGLWLREKNYAYWAASTTLILALLSPGAAGSSLALLGTRLKAIVAGAVCAIIATWFVYPIRTEAIVRRRLADLLLAIDDLITHAEPERPAKLAAFEYRAAELNRVAPPLEWHRRITRSSVAEHPAGWIDDARNLYHDARSHHERIRANDRLRGAVRRAIGTSRRALANHGKGGGDAAAVPVSEALRTLRAALISTSVRKA